MSKANKSLWLGGLRKAILLCLRGVDMAILGWVLYLAFAVLLTVSPIPFIYLSALGGGLKKAEQLYFIAIFLIGCSLIYHAVTLSPFTITLN